MVHPKVYSDPMLRERYGIKSTAKTNIWLAIGLTLIAITWFIWSGSNFATPQVRSQLISFKVINDQSVSINYTVEVKDLKKEHSCDLVARDIDKNVVGEITDQMKASELRVGKNLRSILISTRTPAVNAGISSCQ